MKRYAVRPPLSENERKELQAFDDITARLLHYRNIRSQDEADRFIQPDYIRDTHDPLKLKDMKKAIDRILKALDTNQKVVIYSDYDTDGIPAAVILHDAFGKIGLKNFTNYIPHRHDEGFGLNVDAVENFAKDGVELLITLDCGIADIEAVEKASAAGIDVIIVDHHMAVVGQVKGKGGKMVVGEMLPRAYAIVNPKQGDCTYPEKMLCAAGVTYKLVQALFASRDFGIKAGWEKWLLDMVGIATLSDMVPLTGENRAFAYYGLTVLRKTPRLGLVKLFREVKLDHSSMTEEDVGFTLGPRINAASRMGVPKDAFDLLAAQDATEAEKLARHLNAINDERKTSVATFVKELKKQVRARQESSAASTGNVTAAPALIVAGNPHWRPALLGLAANTLAGEYMCPVFIWGRDGDEVIKGSCRSDGEIHLLDLMRKVPEGIFIQFGGHAQAGGFSVHAHSIHLLEDALAKALIETKEELAASAAQALTADAASGEQKGVTHIDADLSIDHVTWNTYRSIEKLAPFGMGNPKPIFRFVDVTLAGVKSFGKEKNHLELAFENSRGSKVTAIGFFMSPASFDKDLSVGRTVTLVASLEKSTFRNFPELRLRIVDVL